MARTVGAFFFLGSSPGPAAVSAPPAGPGRWHRPFPWRSPLRAALLPGGSAARIRAFCPAPIRSMCTTTYRTPAPAKLRAAAKPVGQRLAQEARSDAPRRVEAAESVHHPLPVARSTSRDRARCLRAWSQGSSSTTPGGSAAKPLHAGGRRREGPHQTPPGPRGQASRSRRERRRPPRARRDDPLSRHEREPSPAQPGDRARAGREPRGARAFAGARRRAASGESRNGPGARPGPPRGSTGPGRARSRSR